MSKQHITQMRNAVQNYYKKAKEVEAKIRHNDEIYRSDIAEEENAKIRAERRSARFEAENVIKDAQDKGRAEALKKWSSLNGSEMTDDAKLLQLDITPAQFADIVARYKKNATMSALLRQYGDRRNKEAAAEGQIGIGLYDTSVIPTPEERASVYDKFAMSARDLLLRMDQDVGFGTGLESPMLATSVEQFGEPNDFTAELFEML